MSRDRLRVFVAVDIGEPRVLDNLSRARDLLLESRADLKPVATENLHITIRFIGECPRSIVENICSKLSTISFKPFKVVVKGIGVFPNITRPRVIWAGVSEGVDELNEIHKIVEKILRSIGIPREREKFVPHITLARVKSGRNIARLVKIIESLADMEFGEFMVDRVVLKRSVLTPSGPIYSDLCDVKAKEND